MWIVYRSEDGVSAEELANVKTLGANGAKARLAGEGVVAGEKVAREVPADAVLGLVTEAKSESDAIRTCFMRSPWTSGTDPWAPVEPAGEPVAQEVAKGRYAVPTAPCPECGESHAAILMALKTTHGEVFQCPSTKGLFEVLT